MNELTGLIILLIVSSLILAYWFYKTRRLKCSYNGPFKSFAIWDGWLCECSGEYARRIRKIKSDECLELDSDGNVIECKQVWNECATRLTFPISNSQVGICRGPNVKPLAVDLRWGIEMSGDRVIPRIECSSPVMTRDAKLWFDQPACIDSRVVNVNQLGTPASMLQGF